MERPTLPDDLKSCINAYVEGMAQSSRALTERAFHPDARIAGPDDGVLKSMDREAFVQLVSKQPPVESIPHEVLSVTTHGNIAQVILRDTYLGRVFIDHLALVRLDEQWRILNKLWHVEARL